MVKYDGAVPATKDNITRHMRFACWITKATNTLKNVILVSFSRHQWLRERAYILRDTFQIFDYWISTFLLLHHNV
jgi:hypothetical protein